jgi:CDP-6-deoxy-D-xylo-4-hexulose-3-dehydrase
VVQGAAERERLMRSLVIGASGQVGAQLMRVISLRGYPVAGTYFKHPIDGIRLDVRDRDSVGACINDFKPEVVYLPTNLAGGADYCETHPEEARELFVDGTASVLDAVSTADVRVVLYSSDYIFDGARGPYSEDDEPSPINVYGHLKADAEHLVRQASDKHLIIRTTVVFGWNPSSMDFAMQVWRRLSAGEPMRVPSDQVGNPTLADYLAEVTLRLVESGAEGIFNVVGRDRIPRSEFGKLLARTFALDPSLIIPVRTSELNRTARRPLEHGLKTSKLQSALGTEAMPLDEALKRLRRQWRTATHQKYSAPDGNQETTRLRSEIRERVQRYWEATNRPARFEPFKTRIQYAGRVFGADEVANLVDSGLDFWLTLGPYGEAFEARVKARFGAKDFLFVNSGSSANLVAVTSLTSPYLDRPLRPGDEVITPAVTFPTTLAPIVQNRLVPVFVDCEVGTYNPNPAQIEAAITSRTRAIVIPHTLGNPCRMDAISDIAKRRDLYLIEDCCDAFGSTFAGKLVGTFGDASTLSFYPAHHITTGEGGGVVVNRPGLSRIARSIRDWGRDCWCAPGENNTCGRRFGWCAGNLPEGYDHKYIYSHIGYNLKPTDMQAAVGVIQLDRLDSFVERRRRNFRRLYDGLSNLSDHLVLARWEKGAEPAWFAFPVTVAESGSRRALIAHLEGANIETRELFAGNILSQPGYQHIEHRVHGTLHGTERIMRDTFFVGVYPGITDEMVDFMIERFQAFFRSS